MAVVISPKAGKPEAKPLPPKAAKKNKRAKKARAWAVRREA